MINEFTIKVSMDDTNTITKAVVILGLEKEVVLEKTKLYAPSGESWLVHSDGERQRMIVLSQIDY
jgi:hypothetical protein